MGHGANGILKRNVQGAGIAALGIFVCICGPSCTTVAVRPEPVHKVKKGLPEKPGREKQGQETAAARVNGVEITREAYVDMMRRIAGLQDGGDSPEEVREKALNVLILQELCYQEAVAEGLHADSGEVEDIVEGLKRKLESEDAYLEFLEEQGMSETEFRLRAARNLSIERIVRQEVMNKALVPEAHLKAEYERVKERYSTPEKIFVVDIAFKVLADPEAVRRKAETVLSQLRNTPDRDPWRLEQDGSFLITEREIRREQDKELYAAVISLNQGEISRVLQTPDGPHIVKLLEYRKARLTAFDELKPLLMRNLIVLYREKRLREWEAEMRGRALIEILSD